MAEKPQADGRTEGPGRLLSRARQAIAGLVGLGLVFLASRLSRGERGHAESAASETGRSTRTGWSLRVVRAVALALVLVIVAGLGLASWALYRTYVDYSRLPPEPNEDASAKLYFDAPCVRAQLRADITEGSYGTQLDFLIKVEATGTPVPVSSASMACDYYSATAVAPLSFLLVLTGSSRPSGSLAESEYRRDNDGCLYPLVYGVPDLESCASRSVLPDGTPNNLEMVTAEVIRGVVAPNESGYSFSQVTVSTSADFTSSSNLRTFFRFPEIGTTYLPTSRGIALDFGDDQTWVVPDRLDVAVDAGEFDASERVETVSPELLLAGHKSWYVQDASVVQAKGSWVDAVTEGQASQRLFVVAILAGVVGSIVATVVLELTRVLAKLGSGLRRRD